MPSRSRPRKESSGICNPKLKKLKLLHITKNAGTALEKLGKELGMKWGKQWKELQIHRGKLHPPHAGRLRSEWWHVPPQFFVEDPYSGYVPFAVVRCPYTRAISEFRCCWKGYCAPVGMDETKKCRRKEATSLDLNRWLQQKLSPKAIQPPHQNAHFIPQHLYIFDAEGKPYVAKENLVRFEHLTEDLAKLGVHHGIDFPPLPRVNESEMPKFSVEDLDQVTRDLIESGFAKDFDLLGFQRLDPTRSGKGPLHADH
ncbi:Ubiquitin-like domain-containing protein [Durusdinium trenchii]|uniref:Ubiquitin-like domain-containing protein n=1 Tax=Durusdinium trenchii TaxID=1381693 RepID=A0ABP0PPQ2_9DINO